MQGRRHSFRFVKMEGIGYRADDDIRLLRLWNGGKGGAVLRVLRLRSEGIVEFS